MNPTVRREGMLWWKKTVVEHGGGTTSFSGSAKVSESDGNVCIKEQGVFASETTCFLKQNSVAVGENTSLPDGKVVGRSKSIEVRTSDGEFRSYRSGPLSLHSMEKNGDEIVVKKSGLFGDKIVDKLSAAEVSSISSEDCNVCKAVNPLYK